MLAGIPMRTLLEAIRAGDRDALGTVYTALFDGLWKFALLHTRSPSTAMDVVQDVFLTLWTRREALQPETDIGVYLAVAVRHNAINRGKHQRVADRLASAVAVEYTELPGQRQQELAADARVEVNEFLAAYHRAVATLTEREQIVAYLRWEEGWTFERIGEVLGLSKVGVRKIVLRAQAKVQELLKPFRR
jgi:RNA polymerase sigma-70 factor (ECF subfamily)